MKWTFVLLLLHVLLLQQVSSRFQNVSTTKEIKKFLKHIFNNQDLLRVYNALDNSNILKDCLLPIAGLPNEARISIIDSAFKPPPGILAGNLQWLGNYRECMKQDDLHFCTMSDVLAFQKLPLTIGVCVPEKCTADDVVQILKDVSEFENFTTVYQNMQNIQSFGTDHVCYKKEEQKNSGAKIMIVVSICIVLLCLIGTIVEVVGKEMRQSNKQYKVMLDDKNVEENSSKDVDDLKKNVDDNKISMHQVDLSTTDPSIVTFFTCFSLLKNTRAILNTNIPKGSITALNGMRTISITWVILGHCLIFGLQFIDDAKDVFSWLNGFAIQAILNATPSVDSFFFLSGLLVGYLSMKQYNNKGKLPLLRYYVHRYIRLTPSYAYLILFWIYLYPLLGNGPNWYTQGPHSKQAEDCKKYWWTNLLYISNFYPELQNMCMNWSWYLANDMQFYVISPLILYAAYRFKWIGLLVSNGTLLLACFIVNGVLIYHYNLSPLFYNFTSFSGDPGSVWKNPLLGYMKYVYMKPYTRISPYLVGLVLGYILINKIDVPQKLRKIVYPAGWIVAIGLGMAVVYGPYSRTDHVWGMTERMFYGIFFRFVWAVAIGWVIYASHNGQGGLVNTFLSWKAFVPLSRLTYAVYLIHPMVIYLFFASTNTTTDFSVTFYVYFFVASVFLSFMSAFVVAVCFEYPVFNLEKFFFNF